MDRCNRVTVGLLFVLIDVPSATTEVNDPPYLSLPFATSSNFKKLPGATGWNPTP